MSQIPDLHFEIFQQLEVLEHKPNLLDPKVPELPVAHGIYLVTVELDLAGFHHNNPGQDIKQGCFS